MKPDQMKGFPGKKQQAFPNVTKNKTLFSPMQLRNSIKYDCEKPVWFFQFKIVRGTISVKWRNKWRTLRPAV
jgi:hypothetical protein